MKAIPGNSTGPQWKDTLLDDLVFIKKHLRYRISKRTIPSVAALGLIFVFGGRMLWITLMISQKGNSVISWFLVLMLAIIFVSGILRYWRLLRFRSIPTPFFANENMNLIDAFLRSQQLNLYRHPKAPEVFQILSRPLGNSEQREVMIFIADDKRILINSHFINQKWTINAQSRNSSQMANRLRQWISIHYQNPNTDIIHQ